MEVYIVLTVKLLENSVKRRTNALLSANGHSELQEFPKSNNVGYFQKIMQTMGKYIQLVQAMHLCIGRA